MRLELLREVGSTRAELLRQSGLRTVEDVARSDQGAIEAVLGRGRGRIAWLHARSLLNGKPLLIDGNRTFPTSVIWLDVEASLDGDDPWLVGVLRPGDREVEQFMELDPARHRAIIEAIGRVAAGRPGTPFATWGSFDRSSLVRACRRLGLAEPEWLDRSRWLDALTWVSRAVVLPLEGMGLKEVAAWFGYRWTEGDVDGLRVGAWYSAYLTFGRRFDVDRVRSYNRDDVMAMPAVVRGVSSLMSPSLDFGG